MMFESSVNMDLSWTPTSVQVTAVQARGLRAKGKHGTNDAYAVMQVSKEKFQTSVVEKSVAPVWREEAAFELLLQPGPRSTSTLQVHVLHRALVGPDKLLGQAVIDLVQLREDTTRDKTAWFKLLDKTGKSDKDRGEVLVDIQFMRNNMTASMFDLSSAGKSRSRLGKFKDKVRGKKKESDASSIAVPTFDQVLTDSEEEGKEGLPEEEKKKKHKMKSLFAPKSNLHKSMSQSMTVLPGKDSSLTGSLSSLNVDPSEGKKKFKFLKHKRSDSKDSQKQTEQSNVCINGSHVYCEEPQPRSTRAGSNFSLTSSGHGSLEDVPESSPSVDSLRVVQECSSWTETEEGTREDTMDYLEDNPRYEEEEESTEEGVVRKRLEEIQRKDKEQKSGEDCRVGEQNKVQMMLRRFEKDKKEKRGVGKIKEEKQRGVDDMETRAREEENLEKAEEERRQLQEEMEQRKRDEEMLLEEKRRQEEEVERMLMEESLQKEEAVRLEQRRKEEEQKLKDEQEKLERERIEEEKKILLERMQKEEQEQRENELRLAEEERIQKEEEELLRRANEEKREEEERKRIEEQKLKEKLREEEMVKREEENKRRVEQQRKLEEEKRIQREQERLLEEEARKEEEENFRREVEEKQQEEQRKWEEEKRMQWEQQLMEEEKIRKEDEHLRRKEELLAERKRLEAEERERVEEERKKKEAEERERVEEERIKKEAEERERVEEERMKEAEERERVEEERIKKEEEERERVEEERMKKEAEERERVEEERIKKEAEERERVEEERIKKEAEERERVEEERIKKEAEERERVEEERIKKEAEEKKRFEEERIQKAAEEKKRFEEERIKKEAEEKERIEKERLEEQKRIEEEQKRRGEREKREEERIRIEEAARKKVEEQKVQKTKEIMAADLPDSSNNPFDANISNNPFDVPDSPAPSSLQTRCPSDSSDGSEAALETDKDLSVSQRKKTPAPQPPGGNPAVRRRQQERDDSPPQRMKDKRPNTVTVVPQRLAESVPSLRTCPTDNRTAGDEGPADRVRHSKGLAPSRPSQGLKSSTPDSKSSLNPFEDSEDTETVDPEAKSKSSKGTRAPKPPANTTTPSSTSSEDLDLTPGNQTCDPERDSGLSLSFLESPPQKPERQKSGPPQSARRRLQPVKPLNALEHQDHEQSVKSTLIMEEKQTKRSEVKGPYSLLTLEELVRLVQKQEQQLSDRDKKIAQLEQYIDCLLVRVMEEQPSILMSLNSMKKTA